MPTGLFKFGSGVALIAVFCLGTPARARADNLILNPGFEGWNGTDFDSWTEYDAWMRTTDAHTGSYAVVFGANSGHVTSNQLAIAALTPGMYEFGAWFRLYYEGSPSYDFAHVNADIVADGSFGELYQSFDAPGLVWTQVNNGYYTQWFLMSGTFNLTASSGTLELVLALMNNDTNATSKAYVDDAYLRPVPEPASLALLGLGLLGLGLVARRRRR